MSEDSITTEMVVAAVLRDWPQTIPVFIGYRMGCVGCAMSAFDTIADVVKIYNLQTELFLYDLNEAIHMERGVSNEAQE